MTNTEKNKKRIDEGLDYRRVTPSPPIVTPPKPPKEEKPEDLSGKK